uniref:Antimicrobial peptide VpCT1 n=1 Tax=Mesomexovis punctatus TaxID=1532993 RepID=NDBT1_MESPU
MKNQFAVLLVALVLLQLFSQSEAFWSTLLSIGKSLLGKRGLRNFDLEQMDDTYEPELSEADLRYLQDLLR